MLKANMLRLWVGVSLGAMAGCGATGAMAQVAGQAPAPLPATPAPAEPAVSTPEIIVTGSQIARRGYDAPTPVTAVTTSQLAVGSPSTIAVGLVQSVPALQGSTTAANAGNNTLTGGQSYLNLRDLGPQRTLVLLDGHRVAPTALNATTDINLMPTGLVKRVEVVTGGASAAYGSDAVAGVVNFVLDTNFTGFKGDVSGGISDRGDDGRFNLSLSYGTKFAGDKGHLIANVEYSNSNGVLGNPYPQGKRSWQDSTYAVFAKPGGGYFIGNNAHLATGTNGGLITSGPLAGIEFGQNGAPQQFVKGQYAALWGQGGDGPNTAPMIGLDSPLRRLSGFVHANYDFTPDVTGYVELSAAHTHAQYPSSELDFTGSSAPTININNPYLPASIVQQMTTAGISSFKLNIFGPQLGILTPSFTNDSIRAVIGLKGRIADNWSWDIYYQHGQNRFLQQETNNINLANFYQAANAVVNPANGAIVCQSSIANPGNGCVPINLIGTNGISQAALNYVHGHLVTDTHTRQDVVSARISGDLPVSTWAGKISIATGAEYRNEYGDRQSDPVIQSLNPLTGIPGGYRYTNLQPVSDGHYNTKELFAETVVPLARDIPLLQSLDLNGAVRYTDYSTSGGVVTWKAGLTYVPFHDLKIRATQSRDIRAPNINELYSSSLSFTGITDPVTHTSYNISPLLEGNLALHPEKANTTTIGAIYQPSWLPRFAISVDWYKITVNDAISTLNVQNEINECYQGNASLCSYITRDPTSGVIISMAQPYLNLQSLKTNGVDIESNYRLPVGTESSLTLHLLASYTGELSTAAPGSPPIDLAGVLGSGLGGVPHWTGNFSVQYQGGKNTLTIRERYVGGGAYNPLLNPGLNIPAVFYTDLTAERKFEVANTKFVLYASVVNLFDRAPPIDPGTSTSSPDVNLVLHDAIGRAYSAGLRFNF